MVHSRFALAAIAAAVLGSASGKMNITSPGGPSQWWITDSWNRITWTDNILQNFTVRLANSNPTILPAPVTIGYGIVYGMDDNYYCRSNGTLFDCTLPITPQQANRIPATGYTLTLSSRYFSDEIFATSEPFEIKASGTAPPALIGWPTSNSQEGKST